VLFGKVQSYKAIIETSYLNYDESFRQYINFNDGFIGLLLIRPTTLNDPTVYNAFIALVGYRYGVINVIYKLGGNLDYQATNLIGTVAFTTSVQGMMAEIIEL
jgi:hypothetical protein